MRRSTLIERLDHQPKRHWQALISAIPAIIGAGASIGGKFIGQKGASPPPAPTPPAAAPAAPAAPAGVAPGTTPDEYKNQESAYWTQLLTGTGNIQPGGGLPADISSNIDRQAQLIK